VDFQAKRGKLIPGAATPRCLQEPARGALVRFPTQACCHAESATSRLQGKCSSTTLHRMEPGSRAGVTLNMATGVTWRAILSVTGWLPVGRRAPAFRPALALRRIPQ